MRSTTPRALRAVLEGEDRGAHRDCLLLGTALALEVAGVAASRRARASRAPRRRSTAAPRGALLEALARRQRAPEERSA